MLATWISRVIQRQRQWCLGLLSLGKEHIPRTEDMPLISSSMGVSFSLLPWNVFDGHAAMDIPTEPAADCVAEL